MLRKKKGRMGGKQFRRVGKESGPKIGGRSPAGKGKGWGESSKWEEKRGTIFGGQKKGSRAG